MTLGALFALIICVTIAAIVGAIVTLRRMQASKTARLFAGMLAGFGAWILAASCLQRAGSLWPLIVLAVLLAVTGGRHGQPDPSTSRPRY